MFNIKTSPMKVSKDDIGKRLLILTDALGAESLYEVKVEAISPNGKAVLFYWITSQKHSWELIDNYNKVDLLD